MTQDVLDLAYLDRETFSDVELQEELCELFVDQARSILDLLDGCSDPVARREAAHRLSGASRALGAWRAAKAATAVETIANLPLSDPALKAALDDLSAATIATIVAAEAHVEQLRAL